MIGDVPGMETPPAARVSNGARGGKADGAAGVDGGVGGKPVFDEGAA